jgi:hypothetical protein
MRAAFIAMVTVDCDWTEQNVVADEACQNYCASCYDVLEDEGCEGNMNCSCTGGYRCWCSTPTW